MSKILIIDSYSLAYSAYYGARTKHSNPARISHLATAFLNSLKWLLIRENPDQVVLTFDAPGRTWHHDIYAEYKATREEKPADFMPQLKETFIALRTLGFATAFARGFEADDVIASIIAKVRYTEAVIASRDKDLFQLITPSVSVVDFTAPEFGGVRTTPFVFRERFGFEPSVYPLYKALVGDKSDNLPGVRGIGEKKALGLVALAGTAENLMSMVDDLPPKVGRLLKGQGDVLQSMLRLVTVRADAPLVEQPYDRPRTIAPAIASEVGAAYEFDVNSLFNYHS